MHKSVKVATQIQRMRAVQGARSALREDAAAQRVSSVLESEPLRANRRVIKVKNHEDKEMKKAAQRQLESASKIQKETTSADRSEDWSRKGQFYRRTYSKAKIADPLPWVRVELDPSHIEGGRD